MYGLCGSKSVGERCARCARRARRSCRRTRRASASRVAHPDRQRRAPVAVARDRPVDVVLEPLAEPARPDLRRMPVDARVAREHRVLERRRAHEPRRARVVEQRRAAAPAVRIRVLVQRPAFQSTPRRFSSSMITGSASFTNMPPTSGIVGRELAARDSPAAGTRDRAAAPPRSRPRRTRAPCARRRCRRPPTRSPRRR